MSSKLERYQKLGPVEQLEAVVEAAEKWLLPSDEYGEDELLDKAVRDLLAARELEEAERELPETFYAGDFLHERIRALVRSWQNAIRANENLEAERDRLREALTDLRSTALLLPDGGWIEDRCDEALAPQD